MITPIACPNGNVPGSDFAANPAAAQAYLKAYQYAGEMVMNSGTALGPTSLETGSVDPDTGLLTSSPARTRVLYDGSPAPLIFGSVGQSGAIVPYSVSGKPQTQVEVEYAGIRSSPMLLDVAETSPGLFAADFSGRGQEAILNEDGTSNSAANPAPLGSVITLYGTGAGDTSPPGEDGRIVSNPFPAPLLPISVTNRGSARVRHLYAGAAPSEVAGKFRIDVRTPPGTPSGDQPVIVTVGNSITQAGVTAAIR